MTLSGGRISVLLDEGTPVLAGAPFFGRGHRVIRHDEVCAPRASDEVVAAQAILNGAILIAVDLDHKRLVRRFGSPTHSERFRRLNLISVECPETLAEKRLGQALSFIEHEWDYVCRKPTRRLWITIGSHRLTTYR